MILEYIIKTDDLVVGVYTLMQVFISHFASAIGLLFSLPVCEAVGLAVGLCRTDYCLLGRADLLFQWCACRWPAV